MRTCAVIVESLKFMRYRSSGVVHVLDVLSFALLAIASVVAVVEPGSNIAIYLSLTEDMNREEKQRIVGKAMKISFLVLAFFAIAGQLVFSFFNITISAFQIAGGVLLVDVALRMLHPRKDEYTQGELEDVAVVPLAFPLTAGPGSITTVMLLMSQANGLVEWPFVFVAILVSVSLSYIGMTYADRLVGRLGSESLHVVTKIMAIVVLAIAVQFLINGVTDVANHITHP
jgi:multiple antibiotic resistance protein